MAELINLTHAVGIPPFSGDGEWLDHYSVDELIKTLGTREDDVQNTFTARLLLLLESKSLVGNVVYRSVLNDVITKYWRDYKDHNADFMPAFLANDILRLWRTFCVNYEARTERIPELQKAKGKIKNYKLKHSRLLTCFSGILYLLAVYNQNGSVHPSDARAMIALTPTERLEWMRNQTYLEDARDVLGDLLARYETFLETTNAAEDDLIQRFMDPDLSRQFMEAAFQFGNVVFDALEAIGKRSHFHRLLVV